jgi:carbonic anhydrase
MAEERLRPPLLYTLQLSGRPNPALNAIIPFLDAVIGAELEVTLTSPFPLEMLEINFSSHYATYLGSLTTPPCSEVVTWIVSSRPLALSHEQVRLKRYSRNSCNSAAKFLDGVTHRTNPLGERRAAK